MSNGRSIIQRQVRSEGEVSELKAESATGMNVMTQFGLVYFCPFVGTGLLGVL